MTKSSDSIAAVVVHYESPATLKKTLASLHQSINPSRIFVVDNSSSLERKDFGELATILDDGINRGYAGGVNHGIEHVSSLFPNVNEVLVCTHEAIFRKNSLAELRMTAAAYPEGHLIGPRLVTLDHQGRHVT